METDEYFVIELTSLMQNATKVIHKIEDEIFANYGLTHFHARYIASLARFNKMTMNKLNNALCCDKANTTRAIKDLISRNLVMKLGENKRRFELCLTEVGKKIARECKKQIDKCLDCSFKNFTTQEKNTLFSLLKKLSEGVINAGNN